MSLAPKKLSKKNILSIDPEAQLWPKHTTSVRKLPIYSTPRDRYLVGVDLEYHRVTKKPYMASIGIEGYLPVSNKFSVVEETLKTLFNSKAVFVGHNILNADIDSLNIEWLNLPDTLPKGGFIDTLFAYYLMNQHICYGNKEDNDDEDSPDWERGPGRLRLGSMTSQYLIWSEYKKCRGKECVGPCPEHQEAWYNALDALGPVLCWHAMLEEADTLTTETFPLGVPLEQNHAHLVELQLALNKIKRKGIPVDAERVKKFEEELLVAKENMFPHKEVAQYSEKTGKRIKSLTIYSAGVNPNSPQDVKKWAKEHNIKIDSYTPDDLKACLEGYRKRQDKVPSLEFGYVISVLERLIEYKKLGRGVKNWFAPKYIHQYEGGHRLMPEWTCYGASMSRPVSKKPNVQNIPKRGHLAGLRKALRAPKGYKYLKADAKQGELRVMIYTGGGDPMDIGGDLFQWLVDNTNGLFHEVASTTPTEYLKKPRNGAKQMVHACNYGEGMRFIKPGSMNKGRVAQELGHGALNVFEDWMFDDKYFIGYDGSHLAQRMFGNSSYENRRKVLTAQMVYFNKYPAIKRALRKIMKEAANGYVITPSGHLLKLYNDYRDNVKKALAMYGQCTLSVYMQETVIEYSQRAYPPVMFVHDEIGFLVPDDWSADQCLNYVADMSHKSKMIPGFQCPIDAEWGPSYGELEEVK